MLFDYLKALLDVLETGRDRFALGAQVAGRDSKRLAGAEAAIAAKTRKDRGPAASFAGSSACFEPKIGAQEFCTGVSQFNRAR